jgi:hypothetical protein
MQSLQALWDVAGPTLQDAVAAACRALLWCREQQISYTMGLPASVCLACKLIAKIQHPLHL